MAEIKSFTDIPQSKKLAEFLPPESADTIWDLTNPDLPTVRAIPYEDSDHDNKYLNIIAAWSLTALLSVLPKKYYPIKDHETDLILGKPKDKWCVLYWDATGMQDGEQTLEDNLVDACVSMILKLHDLNLL